MKIRKNNLSSIKKYFFLAICLSIAVGTIAQTSEMAIPKKSAYGQPAFYALSILAIVLLVYILQLSKVLSAIASNYAQKQKKENKSGTTLLILALIGTMQLIPLHSNASAIYDFMQEGFGSRAINVLALIIAFEIITIIVLTSIINSFVKKKKSEKPVTERKTSPIWDKLNQSVSIEKEDTIMTDHEYDGIRELDNSLPPWWIYGFYLTIIWSVFYLGYYHVFSAGPLQLEELAIAEQRAEAAMEEFRKKSSNLIDETTITFLTTPSDIEEGKKLFAEKTCTACHGPQGGGSIGPNLTDEYWMHGGDAKSVFKSIKYGIPEKGMRAWENEITPSQMAQIVAYIHSTKGTNPPGAKEAQGELYTPTEEQTTNTQTTENQEATQPES